MWWLFLNVGPIFNILMASTAMPHYTVTFRFIFEFVVLGVVPGTSVSIDFVDAMLIWLMVLATYLLIRSFKPKQPQQKLSY